MGFCAPLPTKRTVKHRISILLSAAAAAALAIPASASAQDTTAAPAPTTCDVVAAANGNDAAAGTVEQPLRTAGSLADALSDGETGCFRTGTYGFSELNIRAAQATVTSFPGERATLKGQVRIERTATGTVLENLDLNGVNPDDNFSPLVYADDAIIRGNDIFNQDTTNCIHLARYYDAPAPANVIIEDNEIHNCGGNAPNHDHGIYIAESRDLIIRDNRIYDNADRGIQLWPDAQGTLVTGNVIDGNGQGILFGGYEGLSTNHTVVENNIITNSHVRHNVEGFWPDDMKLPQDNVVRNNCIHGADGWYAEEDGSGIQAQLVGFTAEHNIVADPGFVNAAANDFTLKPGSPCAGVLEGDPSVALPISLETSRTRVPEGGRATLTGSVPTSVTGEVSILLKRKGAWVTAGKGQVRGQRFVTHLRIAKTTRFKARAEGALDSNPVRVAAVDTKRKG